MAICIFCGKTIRIRRTINEIADGKKLSDIKTIYSCSKCKLLKDKQTDNGLIVFYN